MRSMESGPLPLPRRASARPVSREMSSRVTNTISQTSTSRASMPVAAASPGASSGVPASAIIQAVRPASVRDRPMTMPAATETPKASSRNQSQTESAGIATTPFRPQGAISVTSIPAARSLPRTGSAASREGYGPSRTRMRSPWGVLMRSVKAVWPSLRMRST